MNVYCLPSRAEGRALPALDPDYRRPSRSTVRWTLRACGADPRSRSPQQLVMRARSQAAEAGPTTGPAAEQPTFGDTAFCYSTSLTAFVLTGFAVCALSF